MSASLRRRLTVQSLESRVTPVSAMTRALDLPDDAVVETPATNDVRSVAAMHNVVAGGLAGFPTGPNDDFVVLSTGDASRAYGPREGYPKYGVDFAPGGSPGDDQRLKVTVPVAPGDKHLKFDFNFLTDEFPSFSVFLNDYNDTFTVKATPIGAGTPSTLIDTAVNEMELNGMPLLFQPLNAPLYSFHSSAYTVDYRIPAGATAVTFDFLVTDVGPGASGHGGGDTAIAIDNFRFTGANQTIWLNFEGDTLSEFPVKGGDVTFPAFQPADIRSPTARATLISSIRDNVAAKFADFDIDFVTTQPAAGPYGTITIGGTSGNPLVLGADADPRMLDDLGTNTTLGAAIGDVYGGSPNDFGNLSPTTPGFVLSGNFDLSSTYAGDSEADLQRRLEVTIAHEVGHTVGAPHVSQFDTFNIMSEFAPRSPFAVFLDAPAFLAARSPDGRDEMNIYDYLAGTLGSSTGSSVGSAAALSQLKFILNLDLPGAVYDVVFGMIGGNNDAEFPVGDQVVEWFTFPQLNEGLNEIELPRFGLGTKATFYASSAPGGPPFFFSGDPVGGDMPFENGFVDLFNPFSGQVNASVPIAYGPLGALTPIPGGAPISVSRFASAGLVPVPAKTGFTFEDDNGNTVTVKLTSKTGRAAIQLNDPDRDGKGSIARIELQATTTKDKLDVKVTPVVGGFNPFVDIGAITGTQIGTISAKGANLSGAGITFGGPVKTIVVNDLFGADIIVGGNFKTKTSITVHETLFGSDIAVDGQLTLKAARIGTGTIRAALLAKLDVKGDAKAAFPITGDFASDVTIVPGRALTAKEAKLKLLGNVTITGRTVGADFIVPGHTGTFKTGTFEGSSILVGFTPTDPFFPFAGGTFTGDFKLGAFTATGLKGLPDKAFVSGNLIAAQVGPVTLASVETNSGTPFGVAAKSGLAKNLTSVKSPELTYDPTGALPQFAQDFFIKVI